MLQNGHGQRLIRPNREAQRGPFAKPFGVGKSLSRGREGCWWIEINQKETLAQVFTDLRYTKKDNEAMSRGMLDALKAQGFLE